MPSRRDAPRRQFPRIPAGAAPAPAPAGNDARPSPALTFHAGRSLATPSGRGGRYHLLLANASIVASGGDLRDGGLLHLTAAFVLDSGASKPLFVQAWSSPGWTGQTEPRVLYSAEFSFGLPVPEDFPIPLGPRRPELAVPLVETTVDAARWPGSIVLTFSAKGFTDAVHEFRVPEPPASASAD